MTGKPMISAASRASPASYTGLSVPGTTGIPASFMVCLASDLFPILSISSPEGPINAMPNLAHLSAKAAFSERKPNPGWMASAFVARAVLISRSISR